MGYLRWQVSWWTTRMFCLAQLNQYQGALCISRVLKTTERTPQRLASSIDPKWVATDSAV